MQEAPPIVTLLSDFGETDWYVGTMKGVILSRCPGCQLVDISHDIPPGDVLAGALVLLKAQAYFPAGTVHLAVVDPGVGGERRPIAARAAGQWFVGPDNGLLAPVLERDPLARIHVAEREELFLQPVSRTFHGRDVFAPVAAYLAAGGESRLLGREVESFTRLQIPEPFWGKGEVTGHVLYIDRFGNGITNIPGEELIRFVRGMDVEIWVNDLKIEGLRDTYSQAPEGEPLALVGSCGLLEISVNLGSAQARLGLAAGATTVRVKLRTGP